jgi:nitrogen regulatory protein PII
MTKREFTILTDVSMITCVVQRGKADKVVQAAQDAGAQGATIYYGNGSGVRERLGLLGLTVDVEKEIITTLVADDSVDRIFERMYFAGELDVPGGGIIYITKLDKMAMFIPHEVLERLSAENDNETSEASEPTVSEAV